jgi:hypothetical protein
LLKKEVKVMVFDERKKAVGILPGEIKDDCLSFIGDDRVTDFSELILDPIYSRKIIDALYDFIINEDLGIELYPLIREQEVMSLLPGKLNVESFEKLGVMPILKLPSSWEEYVDSLSSKKRHELRRKIRKVEAAELKRLRAKDIFKLFELMESSSSEKKVFLDEEMKNFFSSIASYFEKNGALRLIGSFYNGEIMGILFSFQMNGTVYAFNTGYNSDFYKFSPGIVSFALDIKAAIEEGFSCYNFLRGEERFKFDLGAKRTYTWKIKR